MKITEINLTGKYEGNKNKYLTVEIRRRNVAEIGYQAVKFQKFLMKLEIRNRFDGLENPALGLIMSTKNNVPRQNFF